jgi:hypothetical protein
MRGHRRWMSVGRHSGFVFGVEAGDLGSEGRGYGVLVS